MDFYEVISGTFLGAGGLVGMIVGLILGLMIYFDAPADTYWWAAAVLFFGGLADIGFSVMTHQGKAAPPVAPAPAEEA